MDQGKLSTANAPADGLGGYQWSPLQLTTYHVARQVSSRWQAVEVGASSADPCIDAAVSRLAMLGVVELETEAELSRPGRSETLTATYIHTGGLGPAEFAAIHERAILAEGWEDGTTLVTPRSMRVRLAPAWTHIEVASADRHALAVECVELADADAAVPGRIQLVGVDAWLPAKWYQDVTGAPASRLRKAAERGKLLNREVDGVKLYSRASFKANWPQDARW